MQLYIDILDKTGKALKGRKMLATGEVPSEVEGRNPWTSCPTNSQAPKGRQEIYLRHKIRRILPALRGLWYFLSAFPRVSACGGAPAANIFRLFEASLIPKSILGKYRLGVSGDLLPKPEIYRFGSKSPETPMTCGRAQRPASTVQRWVLSFISPENIRGFSASKYS